MSTPLTPTQRAKALGIDYAALAASGRRLRVGTAIVLGVAVLSFAVPLGVWLGVTDRPSPITLSWGAAIGLALGLIPGMVPTFVGSALLQSPQLRVLPARRQQMLAVSVIAGLGVLLLWLCVTLADEHWDFELALMFVLAGPLLFVLSQLWLKRLIDRDHSQLVAMVDQLRGLPSSQSLLGGLVRWIVGNFAIGLVEATGTALLIVNAPGTVLPALAIRSAVFAVVTELEYARGPRAAALVSGAFALVAGAVGVAALLVA